MQKKYLLGYPFPRALIYSLLQEQKKIAKQQPRLSPGEKEPVSPIWAPLRVGFVLLGSSLVLCRSG
jgi:hypothetical protein